LPNFSVEKTGQASEKEKSGTSSLTSKNKKSTATSDSTFYQSL
jgi:hypothetical protein